MQTINLTIPDQYDVPIDQPFLLVSLPNHWKEFITDGHLESMLYDYSFVWERENENFVLLLKCLVFIVFMISSTYFIDNFLNYLWEKKHGKYNR